MFGLRVVVVHTICILNSLGSLHCTDAATDRDEAAPGLLDGPAEAEDGDDEDEGPHGNEDVGPTLQQRRHVISPYV